MFLVQNLLLSPPLPAGLFSLPRYNTRVELWPTRFARGDGNIASESGERNLVEISVNKFEPYGICGGVHLADSSVDSDKDRG